MTATTIDINADAGESFGPWAMGRDEELFPLVTSVNLACGFHAGDPATMLRSVRLAKRHGVAVGAHPGLPDRVGFGRRKMELDAGEAYSDVLYQLGALHAMAVSQAVALHHVKAHGALYMQMLRSEGLTRAVAAAVTAFDPQLPLVVLAGTDMQRWAQAEGARVVPEAFPDRGYSADGHLASRNESGSQIVDPAEAARRALQMVRGEPLATVDGGEVVVTARTLCIHGDSPAAVEIARAVRELLEDNDVRVAAY